MKLGRNRAQTLLERNPVELLYFNLNPCGGGRRRGKLLKQLMLFRVHTDSWQSVLQAWRFKRVAEKSGEMPRRQSKGNPHLSVSMKIKMFLIISIQYSFYILIGYLPDQNQDPFPTMKMQQYGEAVFFDLFHLYNIFGSKMEV